MSATLSPAPRATARCPNCGADAGENFCPRCGQETHDFHRSLGGIASELLDSLAGWDGKIPRTLALLVTRPGGLTTEFLAGRRARYLRPLRLYLTMSVVFFLSLNILVRDNDPRRVAAVAQAVGGRVPEDSSFDAFLARHRDERGDTPGSWMKRGLSRGLARLKSLPKAEQQRVFVSAFVAKAPNVVFVLLPVFALLVGVLYRRSGVFYAEHLIFALHNHAFAYLALTVARTLSVVLEHTRVHALTAVPLLWMPLYFFVSMRRVYGGSRVRTLVKFVALSVTYGAILFAATVLTLMTAIVALA